MASTYTGLGTELMTTGENAGTWGTTTNTNLQIIEQMVGGYIEKAVTSTPTTLSVSDGSTGAELSHRIIKFTGTISADTVVTVPLDVQQMYILLNGTSGNYLVTFKYVSGSGSTVVFKGTDKGTKLVYATADDGTNPNMVDTGIGSHQIHNTLTVGIDDTGYDVKFFGDSAGAYMEWDTSADQLRIMGASADATTSTGKLLLATSLTDINANDVIGKIEFQAPHEAGGTDAITVAASIQALAQATFSSSVNATDLIFYTGHSEANTEKFRFTSQGELGVGGANYGSDGQVLTSTGAGTAPAWEDASGGGITALNNATQSELVTIGSTTTELDAEANLTFTGSALTCIGTITVGVDNTGHDVKYFGATSGSYALWDESADSLLLNAATLDLNGTADGLILDANGNTTISSPTDDQIDFEIAGADDFTMTANTFTILSGSTIAIAAGGAITNAGTMAPDITSTGKALVFGF